MLTNPRTLEVLRQNALSIFNAGVHAVLPDTMVHSVLKADKDQLHIANDTSYSLTSSRVTLVGFGKAVIGMGRAVEDILGGVLKMGYINVPTGTLDSLRAAKKMHLIPEVNGKIVINEGAENNLPDENAERGAKQISGILQELDEKDILIVLISGGGSALLPAPIPPITLREKCGITKMLANQGADIVELNTVRKRLSYLKGGRLAIQAKPAKVISLILSDVVGNPLDQIASGPTTVNTDHPNAALEIVHKYQLADRLPNSVLDVLRSEPPPDTATRSTDFDHVRNFIVGSNTTALTAAASAAANLGYKICVLSHSITGEAKRLGEFFAVIAQMVTRCRQSPNEAEYLAVQLRPRCAEHGIDSAKIGELLSLVEQHRGPIAILSGGEPWVRVIGRGIGGRNQECALACGIAWLDHPQVAGEDSPTSSSPDFLFLSAGTDGIDGPTSAAGALTYHRQLNDIVGCNPSSYLTDNDANGFYRRFRENDLVMTGITGTNVMDIHVLLV